MAFENPITQMIVLSIPVASQIEDEFSRDGQLWAKAIQLQERQAGFRRLYWGRRVEERDKVQLHVVRSTLQHHTTFLASHAYKDFKSTLRPLTTIEPQIRHATLREYTAGCKALGKGAPVTGTAIYLGTNEAWDAAYALWATIVPHVPGCLGVAGGYILEPVDGHERCFIAWVGWENVEVHNAYHHTQHFRDRRIILRQGNKGYVEYGHAAFREERGTGEEGREKVAKL